ncbi:MAG: hypothetical protein J7K04_05755 [Spirochaetales bacterium]|nr:hypothetical protein [Spirochaetales bacterium]
MVKIEVALKLNGKNIKLKGPLWKNLLDVLREDLGLVGTRGSQGAGNCGLCLVLMNGKTVDACSIPFFELMDTEIVTIEGINLIKEFPDSSLIISEVLKNTVSYSSNGIIMAVKGLFLEKTFPGEDDIKYALSGILSPVGDSNGIIQGVKKLVNLRGRRRR